MLNLEQRAEIVTLAERVHVPAEPLVATAREMDAESVLRALREMENPPAGVRDRLKFTQWRARELYQMRMAERRRVGERRARLDEEAEARGNARRRVQAERNAETALLKSLEPEVIESARVAVLGSASADVRRLVEGRKVADSTTLRAMVLEYLRENHLLGA